MDGLSLYSKSLENGGVAGHAWTEPQPQPEKKSYIGTAIDGVVSSFTGNPASPEVSNYAGSFVKTASLFLRGKFALPATLAAYALDEAKPGDALNTQLFDAGLGMAKGGAMRGAFKLTGGIDNIALKGVTLGIGSRAAELGFSRSTYRDGTTGEYSLSAGTQNLAQGIFSKKALGMDIITFGASAGLLHAADRVTAGAVTRSPFLSTMLTGTTFGLTTGGLEELNRQSRAGIFDPQELGKKMFIKGALDTVAAIPGGLQAGAYHRAAIENARNQLPRLNRPEETTSFGQPIEKLSSLPIELQVATGARLQTLAERLSAPEKTMLSVRVENPERPTDFNSEAHFMKSALLREDQPGLLYDYKGTQIAVPESYAAKLDLVRKYRTEMANHPESEHAALAQRMLGEDAHLAGRALPEDFVSALELLPDHRLARRITLLDMNNPEDIWHQHQLNDPAFRSAAATTKDGDITFFKRQADNYLTSDLSHEWAHVLKERRPVESSLFDAAARMEEGGHSQRDYALTRPEENWAVHLGEDFLHHDADFFYDLAQGAPVRTAIFAGALKPVLEHSTSPFAADYRRRIEHVEQEVVPIARQQLLDVVRKGPTEAKYDDAARLLVHLTPAQDLAKIPELTELNYAYTATPDSVLVEVGKIPQIKTLDLTGTPITRRGPESLRGLSKIETLSLAETAIDDTSLRAVSSMPKIVDLDISNTEVTDTGLVHLLKLKDLTSLNLTGTRVTDAGIAMLRAQHPRGKSLQIFR